MKSQKAACGMQAPALLLLLAVASCAHGAPPEAAPTATPPTVLMAPAGASDKTAAALDPNLVTDVHAIAAAQRALNALGYDVGEADGMIGPNTLHMLVAFQKDHGLNQDGRLTLALAGMLKTLSSGVAPADTVTLVKGDVILFSDGAADAVTADRRLQWGKPDGARIMVAVRPSTAGWPAAARAGLDWATTYALDLTASNRPVSWSSTGVKEAFEIRAYSALSPQDTALAAGAKLCRHFEQHLVGTPRSYPGLACLDAAGNWYISHSRVHLARAATALGPQTTQAQAHLSHRN